MAEIKTKQVHKKTFEGTVVGISGKKTVRALVHSVKTNTKYKKQYTTSEGYLVHDEENKAKVGDIINFIECRPISKQKRWRLIDKKKKV